MVEEPHIDEGKRARELRGNAAVGLAGLAVPRRMIVAEDDGGGIVIKRTLDHFARINGCAVDGSPKHRLEADDSVARVEEQATEHLVREFAESGAKALRRVTRLLECPAPIEWPFEMTPAELERSVQARNACAA
jgi:hypothetical protein